METTTKERIMQHTFTILANLNCGDVIVRSSFQGVSRKSLREMSAHRAAGAVIIDKRRMA